MPRISCLLIMNVLLEHDNKYKRIIEFAITRTAFLTTMNEKEISFLLRILDENKFIFNFDNLRDLYEKIESVIIKNKMI